MTVSIKCGRKSTEDWNREQDDWGSLLRREALHPIDLKNGEYRKVLEGKCILVTGAGGWIGSRLARRLAESDARKLILLDSSEGALYEIDRALLSQSSSTEHVAVLASICDAVALHEVFEQHCPNIVYHAGALKHVPLMESNPFAVVATNTLGTSVLVEAARRYRCEQMIMVSTDKAVDPASLMGASKRMAELVILNSGRGVLRTQVVRLGNVLGSSGSAVPLFRQQIACGGPVTVSHPEVRRFFMTTSDAVESLLNALEPSSPDGLLVAEMGDPIRIIDLVTFLIAQSVQPSAEDEPAEHDQLSEIPIVYTELRPGDKIEESLISRRETYLGPKTGRLQQVITTVPAQEELEDAINALALAVQTRNSGDLLQAVLRVVPEYRPSSLILEQVKATSPVEVTR